MMARRALLLASGMILSGCGPTTALRRALVPATELRTIDRRAPFLKAHLRDGYVVVLSRWTADTAGHAVRPPT